ncbi:unnamed protein product [Periconia digitata]|uniref:Polyketide synthase n=1 Tax=Periconia digitata TaxID=1303443 RepID=A0A9W4UGP7_9PLEO|nr:unnamed protein product [Periconia digitata]
MFDMQPKLTTPLQPKSTTPLTPASSSPINNGTPANDTIAIVGFSLRLPGDATSTDAFWKMLMEGRTTDSEFPTDRISHKAHHCTDPSVMGTIRSQHGSFLQDDIAAFDSQFFGYSEQEVMAMDPQQRILLETTYHALENAGMPLDRVYGTDTSVHTGCFSADYLLMTGKDPELMPKYSGTGVAAAMLSNRISSFFNFRGPSLTIDTACSSSLVALDQSCQSLKLGSSSMGVVAGCNLIFSLDTTIGLSNLGFLSPQGVSSSFDYKADGYGRGEGFGVVILKRLADAVRDGDTVRAVIRGTGTNQDGDTPLAQPSREAQARLIKSVYEKAELDPAETRYVEAHGTGTAVGDPLEATAIGLSFASKRPANEGVYVSSLKANFGHLEGAAGIAGLIKTVLVLEYGMIPPLARLEKVNPNIDVEFLKIQFPTEPKPWPEDGVRRASVNSFGFGGTNAHAIVEDAYHYMQKLGIEGKHRTRISRLGQDTTSSDNSGKDNVIASPTESGPSKPQVLVFSAHEEWSLTENMENLKSSEGFQQQQEFFDKRNALPSLAHNLLTKRSLLPWRSFAVVDSNQHLKNLSVSKPILSLPRNQLSLAFVFTGQGAQWCRMGKELFAYETFRQSVAGATLYLNEQGCDLELEAALTGTLESINQLDSPDFAQPACTIIQTALIDLLASVNVHPSVVVGHSSGEIAAAYAARAISRENAWKLAWLRGKYSKEVALNPDTHGAMVAVGLSAEQAHDYIYSTHAALGPGTLTVACVNSPTNVTVSGNKPLVEALTHRVQRDGHFARLLKVPVAYHSGHMHQIADLYCDAIGSLDPQVSTSSRYVNMVSSVTGRPISHAELRDPSYWVRNLTSEVKFQHAMSHIFSTPAQRKVKKLNLSHREVIWATDILEIGPHSALAGPIRDCLRPLPHTKDVKYYSTLIRNQDGAKSVLTSVAMLHCRGYSPDIVQLNDFLEEDLTPIPDLPPYQFNHSKTFWHEPRLSKTLRFRQHGRDPFVGTPSADWNPSDARWRHFLRLEEAPWIGDHVINGSIIYPAAGMLTMAINAALQLCNDDGVNVAAFELSDIAFHSGLDLSDNSEVEVQMHLVRQDSGGNSAAPSFLWALRAYREKWSEISRGKIRIIPAVDGGNAVDGSTEQEHLRVRSKGVFDTICAHPMKPIQGEVLYDRLRDCGYHFGLSFKRIQSARQASGKAWAEVNILKSPSTETPAIIHPATLDGILQILLPGATEHGKESRLRTSVPTRINRLWISKNGLVHGDANPIEVAVSMKQTGFRNTSADIVAFAENGDLRVVGDGIETTAITDNTEDSTEGTDAHNRVCWNILRKPDIDLFQTPAAIEKYLTIDAPNVSPTSEYFRNLDVGLYAFLYKASMQLEKLPSRSSAEHLENYLHWMQSKLNDNNDTIDEAKCLIKEENASLIAKVTEGIAHQHPERSRILLDTANELVNILRGNTDPLNFLFTDTKMTDYYNAILEQANFVHPLIQWLDLYTHKNPNASILEVGAGTGSLTKHIMKSLVVPTWKGSRAKYSQFCFTDVSPSFFAQAKEDFSGCPGMEFKTLDLEQDPMEQGYAPESFDIIFACLVLHATSPLDQTLAHLRTLLKPGGKLIFVEITNTGSLEAGFVFGLLPGWWTYKTGDPDREGGSSPLLDAKEWDAVLARNGFSGADHVLKDNEAEMYWKTSLLISTRVDGQKPEEVKMRETAAVIVTASDANEEYVRMCEGELRSFWAKISRQELATLAAENFSADTLLVIIDGPNNILLNELDEESFTVFREALTRTTNILWISPSHGNVPNVNAGAVHGLARTLQSEAATLKFTVFEADIAQPTISQQVHINNVLKSLPGIGHDACTEDEITEIGGVLCTPRVVEDGSTNDRLQHQGSHSQHTQDINFSTSSLHLTIRTPGLLDTLTFEQKDDIPSELGPQEVQVRVKAIGANFKDCLVTLGRIPETSIGTDCAGVVERVGSNCSTVVPGDHVAVLAHDTYSSVLCCHENLVVKISESINFTDAAKLPTNFVTAYHSLIEVGRLCPGESVLIHSGAGGTGQAAVQIAQIYGAEVFVTVGSKSKKDLLINDYSIPEDHIFYSRDLSFAEGIKARTGGRGVDLILNSLAKDQLKASWSCLAPYGRFLEIGKQDLLANENLPMRQFARNVSFAAIDVAAMITERPHLIQKSLRAVRDMLEEKRIRIAAPMKIFGINEVENALRHLQGGTNAGSVAIEVNDDATVPVLTSSIRKNIFKSDATYVISGGLGGQGRSIAKWMCSHGAKNLLLLSRSGGRDGDAKTFVSELAESGVNIATPACDVTDSDALAKVLDYVKLRLPPIKGCIQASMVLKDTLFSSMTHTHWKAAIDPKVSGSWNLHHLLPANLDFFVMLSSISGMVGSAAQSNYAAGNTYQDALAAFRVSNGLKAVSLNLGVMKDEGYLVGRDEVKEQLLHRKKLIEIPQEDLFNLLEHYCDPDLGIEQMQSQVLMGLSLPADVLSRGEDLALWMERPLFAHLHNVPSSSASHKKKVQSSGQNTLAKIDATMPHTEVATLITSALQEKLARVLSRSREDVDTTKSISAHGVDSLVAVELRNWFLKVVKVDVPIFELLGGGAIDALARSVAEKLGTMAK